MGRAKCSPMLSWALGSHRCSITCCRLRRSVCSSRTPASIALPSTGSAFQRARSHSSRLMRGTPTPPRHSECAWCGAIATASGASGCPAHLIARFAPSLNCRPCSLIHDCIGGHQTHAWRRDRSDSHVLQDPYGAIRDPITHAGAKMARIEDIPQPTRDNILALASPECPGSPWVQPKPLADCRLAVLTSAALHRRSEMPFAAGSAEYRELPATLAPGNMLM